MAGQEDRLNTPPAGAAQALRQGLIALGLESGPERITRLIQYVDLLGRWNRVYNLTAVRDRSAMISAHLLDSLAVQPFIRGPRVIDVGSGAGLPGLPLAVFHPGLHFTLLDAGAKKTRFLQQAVVELYLDNVEIAQVRVQNYRPGEGFATVLCRAYGTLGEFVADAGHLCAPQGRVLAMKGCYPDQELTAIPVGFSVAAVHELKVPGLNAERHLVEIAREGQTEGHQEHAAH